MVEVEVEIKIETERGGIRGWGHAKRHRLT